MGKLAVVSGGLDSSTMLWTMLCSYPDVRVITFDYGQKHIIETQHATRVVEEARNFFEHGVHHDVVELPILPGSALTEGGVEVPKDDYSVETQKVTVVPNRNMVMLSVAASYAIAYGCDEIWYAAHKGDRATYPDCTNEFVHKMNLVLYEGNYDRVKIVAPFIDKGKHEIVKIGSEIGMPFELTWSCYDPVIDISGDKIVNRSYMVGVNASHCGVCGTCRERKMAFKIAGVEDPTRYAQ